MGCCCQSKEDQKDDKKVKLSKEQMAQLKREREDEAK